MDTFSLLQRTLFKELLQTFLVCLIALLALIIIGNAMHMSDFLLNLEVGFFEVAVLLFFMLPMFLIMVLPISCMLSVFLTFLRMSTDRELTAVKAGGISVYQLLSAPIIFSITCMFFALIISLHGISWGASQFRSYILEMANTKAKIVVQPGVFNQDLLGKTLFARKVDPQTGKLEQVIFEDTTQDGETTVVFIAPEGNLYTDEEKGELLFSLYNGKIYQTDATKMHVADFEKYTASIDLSKLLSGVKLQEMRPKDMSWNSLMLMHYLKNAPTKRFQNKVAVEIQKRLALPVACLILGLFAMPIACAFEGVKQQFGIVLALILFFIYYSMFSTGVSIAESGQASPELAIWLPNILFALGGLWGLHVTVQERLPSWLFIRQFHSWSWRKKKI